MFFCSGATSGTAVLNVFREGIPLATLNAPPNVTEFSFGAKDTIDVDFSFTGVDNPAEPATYNWEYRDLWLWVK